MRGVIKGYLRDATFDGKGLLPYIRQINALHPDVVVITGDFVDDGTTKEDMLDSSLYKVVLDHQPCEYDKEVAGGANLVLSGHTHGGQLIPFQYMGEWTRQYERRYGHEKRGETDFIVSSGISDWELLFKTGCRSEYVVVDVKGSR